MLGITSFQNILLLLQDPREEGLVPPKVCKLQLGDTTRSKRPAYDAAAENRLRKRPRQAREEGNISPLLSDDEVDENLVSSQAMYL